MGIISKVRSTLFALLVVLAFLPSLLLLSDFLRVHGSTDGQLTAAFVGAAQEDIFGFGFWPLWLGLALVEAVLLGAAWLLVFRRWFRGIVFVTLAAFVATSTLGYAAFTREFALWSSYVSGANAG